MSAVELATSLVRESELLGLKGSNARSMPISRSTLWRWVNEGKFPKPIKLSEGVTVWRVEEVDAWIRSRGGAK
jgi:predicted DNA-binding transcriptional regulator AlpA